MIWRTLLFSFRLIFWIVDAKEVDRFCLGLWVIRKGVNELEYNASFANPNDHINNLFVALFKNGIGDTYSKTSLGPAYVTTEVHDLANPLRYNASWEMGIYFNSTVYFKKGFVRNPEDNWNILLSQITLNNYQIGTSDLFVSPFQVSQYSPCFQSDCHPNAYCLFDLNGYTCQCAPDFHDLNEDFPGHECQPKRENNECLQPDTNECHANARCIDTDSSYRCECLPGYMDNSPEGSIPGSLCIVDYCSDVDFCPSNTTCKNYENHGACECVVGFVDVRSSQRRVELGLANAYCLRTADVDECALGLTNCSAVAICIDLFIGYECECPLDFADDNPTLPGRECQPKRGYNKCLKPDTNECHANARCIETDLNYRCECLPGYTDSSPEGSIPGSLCVVDYCSDVDFCPSNTTCKNRDFIGACECVVGFVDVRSSQRRVALGLENVYCLRTADVDECALGLTNCSAVAICTDLVIGYECECPMDFADGNPALPGRVCERKSCDFCNRHGFCAHDQRTNSVVCNCHPGFSGQYCQLTHNNGQYK